MRGRKALVRRSQKKADQHRAQQIQPEVRELLDLIAEELAAEYLRLMSPDKGPRKKEGG